MKIAHNPETGEYLALNGDKWDKLTVAANDKGEKLYLGPDGWTPLNMGEASTPQSYKPEPQGGTNLQKFGMGTRGVIKGVLDTVAAPAAMVQNAAVNAFGRPDLQAGSVGDAVSDMIGLPKPQTAGEKFATRFNEGATSLIPAYMTGGLMGGASSPVTRGIGALLQDAPALQAATGGASVAASGAVGDSTGNPYAAMAAGMAAPLAVGGLATLAPGNRVNMARADAFKRAIGEVPSLGVVSDGGFAPMLEAALAKYPVSAGTMRKGWDRAGEALRTSTEDAASRVSGGQYPRTQNQLGQTIIDGVEAAKARQTGAYEQGWNQSLSPYEQLSVPIDQTVNLFADRARRNTPTTAVDAAMAADPNVNVNSVLGHAGEDVWKSADRTLGGVLRDHNEFGGASLGAVKQKRTDINEAIKKDTVASTMSLDSAEAARVSSSLGADILATLRAKAPQVADTLEQMDGTYANWIKKADRIDKRMTGAGREPEAVAAKTEASSLTLGDVIRLKEILSPDEWAKIRGGIMNEIPRSTQGETSSAAFATKMGKGKSAYRPEVQDMLFGNELDDARMIADGMNRVGANINTSNTATQLQSMNMLTGGGTIGLAAGGMFPEAAALAASIYGIPYGAAKLMTSPAVTKGLTSRAYQDALQGALGARSPMLMRGLMSGANE